MRIAIAIAASAMIIQCIHVRAETLREDHKDAYRQLRKDFIIAMAVTAAPENKRMRKEHGRFLKDTNRFLKSIEDNAPLHKAAATYFRGRLAMKLRQTKHARKDLEAVIQTMIETNANPVDLPGGMPSITAVRIFKAFTAVEDGHEQVMEELETIPEGAPKPAYHEVGSLLNNWAEALSNNDQDDLALRAYKLILTLSLWEEEAENPKRKMDLIKLKQNGGMIIQAEGAE